MTTQASFDPNSPAGARAVSAFLSISLASIFYPTIDPESSSPADDLLLDNIVSASVVSSVLISLGLVDAQDLMRAVKEAMVANDVPEDMAKALTMALVEDCLAKHEEITQGLSELVLKVPASMLNPGHAS